MKKILSLLSLILSIGAIPNLAQTESTDIIADYRQKMDSVLQFVDREQFQTGLLYDYGFHLLNPEMFKGEPTDSVCIDLNALETLYIGMYDSRINDKRPFPPPEALRQEINTNEVRIMYIEYDKIDEDALDKGWVTFENEQLRLVEGKPSPFFHDFCFAAAPDTTDFSSNIVSVRFTRSQFYTNANCEITKIEVKSDEDAAFEQVAMETVWTKSFSTIGRHKLTFRVSLSNGKVLESASELNIRKKVNEKYGVAFGKKIDRFAQITPDYSQAGGEIQAIYLNKEKTGGKFIRPLIVVGDFDLTALFGGEAMDLESLSSTPGIGEQMKALSQIFDIIYIKYNDSTDDLMRNGEFVRKAIKLINENRFTVSDDSYVVGLGVGGVVSRIALNLMEKDGEQHKVQKFIAVNAPFRGMNISLNLQSLIRQFYSIGCQLEHAGLGKFHIKESAEKFTNILDSPAVRQLLIYSINSQFKFDNLVHDQVMQNPIMTTNPSKCKTVSIANGYLQAIICQPSSPYFEVDFTRVIFGKKGFGARLKVKLNAQTMPDKQEKIYYNSDIRIYSEVFFKKNTLAQDNRKLSSSNGCIAIDALSGVYFPDFKLKILDIVPQIETLSKFCFVPTRSAFDIDLAGNEDISHIPFNKYYETVSSPYGDFSHIFTPLTSELTPKITGKTYNILGTTELEVENVPNIPLIKYTWNFKNNRFKVVSQSGTKATITPLKYSENNFSETEDFVSVSVSSSIPIEGLDLSGLKTPDAKIYADCISIDGGDNISSDFKPYGLNKVPDDVAQINWTASDGVIVSRVDDFSVKAKVNDIVDNAWIEASFNSYGVEHSFRKNLNSAALEKIEIVSADKWWNKHELVDKYFIRIKVHPTYLSADDLVFCWQNDVYVYDRDGKIVHRKNEDSDNKWPRIDIDLPTISPDIPLGLRNGIAKIETAGTGSVGICLETKGPIMCDSTKIDIGNIGNLGGGLIRPSGMDFERVEPTPMNGSDALVTMPAVELDQTAKGNIYCKVSDTFGNSYEVSIPVESKWHAVYHATPNPANSYLNISCQGNDAVAPMRAPATNGGSPVARALLYNDSMLVREAAIGADGTCRMNVGDLAEGNYYLNIVENDRIVMKQIVVIQH